MLGDQPIRVAERCAVLADGTLAGSILTMDGAFRQLVGPAGLGVVEAARLCATTPARALGRPDLGRLEEGAAADLVVLDEAFQVVQTWVAGEPAWNPAGRPAVSPQRGRDGSHPPARVGARREPARHRAGGLHGERQHRRRHGLRDAHLQAGRPGKVTLDTFDGAIAVHAWDRPDVEVVVEKQAQDDARLQDIAVEKSQDGDNVSLRVRGPSVAGDSGVVIGMHFSPSARLRVAVPKATALELRSGDGSITVEEITGAVSLRTDDGSIVASRLSGDVLARTDDGSIRFREITGKLDVETGDGSVVVNGTFTHLRAKTGDGSVRLAVEPGSRVDDDWTVETRDGSVEVRLPEAVDADGRRGRPPTGASARTTPA